jgi:hypothetical protein
MRTRLIGSGIRHGWQLLSPRVAAAAGERQLCRGSAVLTATLADNIAIDRIQTLALTTDG